VPESLALCPKSFTARADQPLIGVFRQRNGQEVVEYLTDEADLDASAPDDGVAPR
jgi:hypothetical protein